jgi:hypothetical protein
MPITPKFARRAPAGLNRGFKKTGNWGTIGDENQRRENAMQTGSTAQSEAAIWARVIVPEQNGLSPEAARSILTLSFSDTDRARMNELAGKNQEGLLSEEERRELENYVKVGDVLSLLHLKARRSLQG